MKILLLGANGRTGTEFVDLALIRGHEVTAFVRSPERITRRHERLHVVRGDPKDTGQLAAALAGHDAVVSALGPHLRDALRPSRMLAECASSTVLAMAAAGVPRLAIVSAALLFPEKSLQFRIMGWLLRHHIDDLREMERVVTGSPLRFTIVRPPRLIRSRDEHYEAATNALPGSAATSFRAVAKFMLDSLERPDEARQIIGLARRRARDANHRELIRTSA